MCNYFEIGFTATLGVFVAIVVSVGSFLLVCTVVYKLLGKCNANL